MAARVNGSDRARTFRLRLRATPPDTLFPNRVLIVNTSLATTLLAVAIAALLSACSADKPPAEALRSVRTAEIRYDKAQETNRYTGTVQARHEVDQAFRVGGKIVARKVDVGQTVREGDVLAVLDDTDYRLAEEAARQQLDRRHDGGATGRVGSPAEPGADRRRRGERLRRRAHAKRGGQGARRRRRRRRGSSSSPATGCSTRCCARRGAASSRPCEPRVGQVVAEGQPVVVDREPGRARDRRRRAGGSASQRSRWRGTRQSLDERARRRRSTSPCASSRRRRRRRRERTARD